MSELRKFIESVPKDNVETIQSGKTSELRQFINSVPKDNIETIQSGKTGTSTGRSSSAPSVSSYNKNIVENINKNANEKQKELYNRTQKIAEMGTAKRQSDVNMPTEIANQGLYSEPGADGEVGLALKQAGGDFKNAFLKGFKNNDVTLSEDTKTLMENQGVANGELKGNGWSENVAAASALGMAGGIANTAAGLYQKMTGDGAKAARELYDYEGADGAKLQELLQKNAETKATETLNKNNAGYKMLQLADESRNTATKDMSVTGEFLTNTVISALQNAYLMPLAAINMSVPLAALTASAAGQTMYEQTEKGKSLNEAVFRGIVDGSIEAATEKIGIESIVNLATGGGSGVLKEIFRSMMSEAGEEGLSYVAGWAVDVLEADPQAQFSLQDLALAMLGGALSGGLLGGVGATVGSMNNTSKELSASNNGYNQSNDVWFNNISDPKQARKKYIELARKYHPDTGDNTNTMAEISRAYQQWTNNYNSNKNTNQSQQSTAKTATEQAVNNDSTISLIDVGQAENTANSLSDSIKPTNEEMQDIIQRFGRERLVIDKLPTQNVETIPQAVKPIENKITIQPKANKLNGYISTLDGINATNVKSALNGMKGDITKAQFVENNIDGDFIVENKLYYSVNNGKKVSVTKAMYDYAQYLKGDNAQPQAVIKPQAEVKQTTQTTVETPKESQISSAESNAEKRDELETKVKTLSDESKIIKQPKNAAEKLNNALIKTDISNADDLTLNKKGVVSGFNSYQREYVVNELLKGLNTDSNSINVNVPDDGKIEIANSTVAVSNVINKLGYSAKETETKKIIEKIFPKNTERIVYGQANGKTFVSNGYFAISVGDLDVENDFSSYPNTVTANADFTRLMPDKSSLEAITELPRETTSKSDSAIGKPKANEKAKKDIPKYIFKHNGNYYLFDKKYLNTIANGENLKIIKNGMSLYSLDESGEITGLVMGIRPYSGADLAHIYAHSLPVKQSNFNKGNLSDKPTTIPSKKTTKTALEPKTVEQATNKIENNVSDNGKRGARNAKEALDAFYKGEQADVKPTLPDPIKEQNQTNIKEPEKPVKAEDKYMVNVRKSDTANATAKENMPPDDKPVQQGKATDLPESIGAMKHNPKSFSAMANEYGTIKEGENPSRVVDVPKSADGTTKVRQATRTFMEAKVTPDEMIELFEQAVADGEFSYEAKKDKPTVEKAAKHIEENGFKETLSEWQKKVDSGKTITKEDVAEAQLMYVAAAQMGDTDTAMKLAADIAAIATNAGQVVQAQRLLKKATPEGRLYTAKKSIENIQKSVDEKYGKNAPKINVPNNLMDNLQKATTQKEVDDAYDKINRNIAEQLPSTWGDRLLAFRYLSMLGNFRTQIRNIGSNLLQLPARKLSDGVRAGLEIGLKKAGVKLQRTTSLKKATQEQKDFAKSDYAQMEDILASNGKYQAENLSDIEKLKNPFKVNGTWGTTDDSSNISKSARMVAETISKGFTAWNNATTFAMDKGDIIFSRPAYINAMASYMQANNLNAADMKGKTLLAAREWATKQSLESVFREANALAEGIQQFENKNKLTKTLVGGTLPFKRTPINIAVRSLEYTPMNIIRGAVNLQQAAKTGDVYKVQNAIDAIAKGTSGSSILAIGFFMASLGLLKAGMGNSKKDKLEKEQGTQEYSLQIGDYSITMEWAGPSATTLFVGAQMYEFLNDEAEEDEEYTFDEQLNSVVASLLTALDPIFQSTMLQGLNNTITQVGYSKNPIADLPVRTIANYVSQFVPTILGQVARAVDDTRRTTYSDKKETAKIIDTTLQKAGNKIPGVSQGNMPYLDMFGNEIKNTGSNFATRLAYNMFFPGYAAKKSDDTVLKAVSDVFNDTANTDVIPSSSNGTYSKDGKKMKMTAEEYEAYVKERGQTSYNLIESMLQNVHYNKLSSEEKAEVIKDIYAYSQSAALYNNVGVNLSEKNKAIKKALAADVPPGYIFTDKADTNNNGSFDKDEAKKYIDSLGLSKTQKAYLFSTMSTAKNPYT